MKTNPRYLLPATARVVAVNLVLALATLPAAAQDATNTPPVETATPAATTTAPPAEVRTPVPVANPAAAVGVPNAAPAAPTETVTSGSNSNGLTLNFNKAPMDIVLNYLSDAAGFIIQLDPSARLSGYVTVRGKNLTRDEAFNLINSELNRNGYAAIRTGRILKILSKEAAVKSGGSVRVINSINELEDTDEVITAIIPIRFVEASQLVSELSTFIDAPRVVANQAGNSIVITDTQANIRHLVEITKAIDSSAEDVTEVRVFHLDYADPTETASLLSGLFQDSGNGASAPIRFGAGGGRGGRGGGRGGAGGFGGFGGGFNPFAAAFGGGGGQGGNSQTDRIRQRKQIVAVADPRTSSVIVTGTKDLLDQIEQMIKDIDHSGRTQIMARIPVRNANVNDIVQALQDTVGASSRVNNQNRTQTDPFYQRAIQQNQYNNQNPFSTTGRGGGGGGQRAFGQ